MTDRYTRKDAEAALQRLTKALDKPLGHYRPCAQGESNMGANHTFTTIPGGWALDYNPVYGGCVIEELADVPGETWIRHPMGERRMSPREFVQMCNRAIDAVSIARA